MQKTLSQIEYEIDNLNQEKKELLKKKTEDKVDEFTKIFIEIPPKDEADVKRLLRMLIQDIKNIYEV